MEETDGIEGENEFDPKGSRIKGHHHRHRHRHEEPFATAAILQSGLAERRKITRREPAPSREDPRDGYKLLTNIS